MLCTFSWINIEFFFLYLFSYNANYNLKIFCIVNIYILWMQYTNTSFLLISHFSSLFISLLWHYLHALNLKEIKKFLVSFQQQKKVLVHIRSQPWNWYIWACLEIIVHIQMYSYKVQKREKFLLSIICSQW